jgi:hypothetical protein
MYCVRVSLWTVKISLRNTKEKGVVGNLCISLGGAGSPPGSDGRGCRCGRWRSTPPRTGGPGSGSGTASRCAGPGGYVVMKICMILWLCFRTFLEKNTLKELAKLVEKLYLQQISQEKS